MLAALRRGAPVAFLFILAPLVAEYLLGDFAVTQLDPLPVMALLYGSGAIVIRELARHTGRGWPAIFVLGFAYGLLEEGLATQSLFNPNFLGLRLLDYGYIPFLGIGAPWTVLVLTLHPVWSIGVPIAVAELTFPSRRTEPWMGRIGLVWFTLLCILGMSLIGNFMAAQQHFTASVLQRASSAVLALAAIIAAFFLPARPAPLPAAAPNPWLLGSVALLAGSAVQIIAKYTIESKTIPAALIVLGVLALEAAVILYFTRSARKQGWSNLHRFALAAGGMLVYCWWGFVNQASLLGPDHWLSHAVLVAAALLLLFLIWRQAAIRGGASAPHTP